MPASTERREGTLSLHGRKQGVIPSVESFQVGFNR